MSGKGHGVDDEQHRPSRRQVVAAAGLAPLVSLATPALRAGAATSAGAAAQHHDEFRFFTPHEAAVVKAAAARLVPGPDDDPTEKLYDSPGATEAGVVYYIDHMLAAFSFRVPKIFAGGPWSDRHGGHEDHMKHFVPLAPRQRVAWKKRIAQLQKAYRKAVKQLDAAAGGSFATAPASKQDQVLTDLGDVRDLIFGHTIEGMYSVPEYGGNRAGNGWKGIYWPGDAMPRGYTANEVEKSDGLDVAVLTPTEMALLGDLGLVGAARRAGRRRLLGTNRLRQLDA
ncbi:MAG TPA: gluconate 2-dehydrogenase subunit 3 family protein [Mycobacteriales bacterium]|nr:gluconate 2-dehydrogenase subunit 3 family protein [Mycobacteriales bacterium]